MKKQALVPTVVATLLACTGPLACSFSNSSASSADSSGSSARSSGSSSGKESARFQQDVEQYTALYVEEGGRDESAFLAGIGDLARERGVSDWEAEAATWEAIGRALGRSPLTEAERHAYAQAWTDGDADRVRALGRGTATAR